MLLLEHVGYSEGNRKNMTVMADADDTDYCSF
jgi:hypothetical protein